MRMAKQYSPFVSNWYLSSMKMYDEDIVMSWVSLLVLKQSASIRNKWVLEIVKVESEFKYMIIQPRNLVHLY